MNNQQIDEKTSEMSFRDRFFSIPDISPRMEIRDKICQALGIARSSLYDKIRNDRFSLSEKKLISEIMAEPVPVLFPEEQI